MANQQVDILCGPGNNGGDGFCIALVLAKAGLPVRVFSWLREGSERADDAEQAWQVLAEAEVITCSQNVEYQPSPHTRLIVDALFGIGLSRRLSGAFAKTVHAVAASELPVVAVDVPSGQAVSGEHPEWPCISAQRTYTFGALKLSALLPDTGAAWGEVTVLDIGLAGLADQPALRKALSSPLRVMTTAETGSGLTPRPRFTHKGTWGHVLVVAGSRGHAGAALLCGRGAYRGGAGLVTFYVPSALELIMQTGLPEAMCLLDPNPDRITEVPDLDAFDVIVFGPGVGQHMKTLVALSQIMDACSSGDKALVVDADGLNLMASFPKLLDRLPPKLVLTPHPGEFKRLAGETSTGLARQQLAIEYAHEVCGRQGVLVLKDQCTLVASGAGEAQLNFFDGNPGMGSGGMGDTLAGLIGARLASGETAFLAAIHAVAIHARAGDLARARFGESGLLASDVAELLGVAAASFLDDKIH